MSAAGTAKLQEWLDRIDETGGAPRGWEATLAERIEELLSAPSVDLAGAAAALVKSVHARMRLATPEVRVALTTGADAPSGVRQAYRLGQIGFAQLLVSQAALQRADESFLTLLKQAKFRKYVAALASREMTSSELAMAVGEAQESASRKLQQLRTMGITDFRRESKNTINFLTIAARQAWALCQPVADRHAVPVVSKVKTARRDKRASIVKPKLGHIFRQVPHQKILGAQGYSSNDEPPTIPQLTLNNAESYRSGVERLSSSLPSFMRNVPTFALNA